MIKIKIHRGKNTALIDGDLLIYNVGWACNPITYKVKKNTFRYKLEAIKHCDDQKIDHKFIESVQSPIKIKDIKIRIRSLIEENILVNSDSKDYRIFISGKNNYRHSIATYLPYKGNRNDVKKPINFEQIEHHLFTKHDAERVEDIEVDDRLGIEQCKDITKTVICSRDKDLDMIPGFHYNWKSLKYYFITELDSYKTFYSQVLSGDLTDNVQGIFGIGPKTANKLLKNTETEGEMVRLVYNLYKERLRDNPEQRFKENCKLLWIQRELGDYKRFDNILKEYIDA